MKVYIFDSIDELYDDLAIKLIKEIKDKNNINLGLATGSTQKPLYERLVQDYKENKTSYKNVKTFNLDEYVGLPEEHPQSYRYFMDEYFFNHIDINKLNTYIPRGNVADLIKETKKYDELLSKHELDIQILGIGPNGHIAFNEPGSRFDSKTQLVYLTEETRVVNSRFFNTIDEVPTKSITMGIGSILSAKRIILIATGLNKAQAIKDVIEGVITTLNPASILQTHHDVELYLDLEAASLLD